MRLVMNSTFFRIQFKIASFHFIKKVIPSSVRVDT